MVFMFILQVLKMKNESLMRRYLLRKPRTIQDGNLGKDVRMWSATRTRGIPTLVLACARNRAVGGGGSNDCPVSSFPRDHGVVQLRFT